MSVLHELAAVVGMPGAKAVCSIAREPAADRGYAARAAGRGAVSNLRLRVDQIPLSDVTAPRELKRDGYAIRGFYQLRLN